MASISSGRPSDDGSPRYVVNYRDPEGRQRRKTFRRKAEAVAFRNDGAQRISPELLIEVPQVAGSG
ncbi:hypothetical protein BCF74_104149 [Knoellia remsis]|uniref:Uncharacterized protein n=1 Tax=Knoellia remsis TaxID=407159 RepID=A0A2T0UXR0_9MICO|nr:hypothetical protein BCF74_104149 [Knoellia remsis]